MLILTVEAPPREPAILSPHQQISIPCCESETDVFAAAMDAFYTEVDVERDELIH